MMMNSCWPYGGSGQPMSLDSHDRPFFDSRTLAMLAQYQSALLNLPTTQNATDDNNNTSQRLNSTTNESNEEQRNENNNSTPSSGVTKKLWRPHIDIMR